MDRAKAIIAHREARKKLLAAGLIDSSVFLRPVVSSKEGHDKMMNEFKRGK